MFGDGKIKVIKDEAGDLYINMWEMTGHLMQGAEVLDSLGNVQSPLVSDTMRLIAVTLCDLALWELGKNQLSEVADVNDMIEIWQSNRN
jgi:hypothetical protein